MSAVTQELVALEQAADEWMHRNPARYRETAEQMLTLSRHGEPGARARAQRAYGNALRMAGELPAALRAIRSALRLWHQAGDEVEWARTQTACVAVLAELGNIRGALSASALGLAVFLRHEQPLPAARLLNNTGGIYLFTGRPHEALTQYARARSLASSAGDGSLLSRIDMHRAVALQALGRHTEALTACAGALRRARPTGQKLHAARIQVTAAISLFQLGRFSKALRRFSQARTVYEEHGATRDVAECDLHICACYLELNRVEQALERVTAVIEQPGTGRAWYETAYAWFYQAVALARCGRLPEARAVLLKPRQLFAKHHDAYGAGRVALEEAQILLRLNETMPASRWAARAKQLFAVAGSRLEEARATLLLAETLYRGGRLARAWSEAQAADRAFRRAHTPGPRFQCLHLMGQIAMQRGAFTTARRLLARAIRLAEQMRGAVQVTFREGFLDDKAVAYGDMVWLHLQEGRVAAARRLADLAKSRGLSDRQIARPDARSRPARPADQRLLAEIEAVRLEYQQLTLPSRLGSPAPATGSLRSWCVDPDRRSDLERRLTALWDEWELRQLASGYGTAQRGARRAPAAARLGPKVAMVEYLVIRTRVIAFVSNSRGLRAWADLGPLHPVTEALELLHLNLDTALVAMQVSPGRMTGLTRNAQGLLAILYRRLWAPLLPWLTLMQQVVVIPHGPLHLVPFAALYDGKEYLVAQAELTLAPSRAIWAQCRERTGESLAGRPDLVMGCNADGQIPLVEEEARAVGAALQAAVHLGADASLTRLAEGAPYRIVHLAVHGQFRADNPHFSTLLLADGPLTAIDAVTLPLHAAMVVLSGCETGISKVTHGEELVGLVAAFLSSGCASVLASHWRVADPSAADLMQRVYKGLLAGRGKAAALREAQASLAGAGLHPVYWAAFSLIGDGGPVAGI
ncbi:MAG: hypothetical protein JWN15_3025 [Firmicutes bacterium]|nr:hypothetical protein [Bacillota bacterium]